MEHRLLFAVHAAEGHSFPRHPECPERVEAIVQAMDRLAVFEGTADGQVGAAAAAAAAA